MDNMATTCSVGRETVYKRLWMPDVATTSAACSLLKPQNKQWSALSPKRSKSRLRDVCFCYAIHISIRRWHTLGLTSLPGSNPITYKWVKKFGWWYGDCGYHEYCNFSWSTTPDLVVWLCGSISCLQVYVSSSSEIKYHNIAVIVFLILWLLLSTSF